MFFKLALIICCWHRDQYWTLWTNSGRVKGEIHNRCHHNASLLQVAYAVGWDGCGGVGSGSGGGGVGGGGGGSGGGGGGGGGGGSGGGGG